MKIRTLLLTFLMLLSFVSTLQAQVPTCESKTCIYLTVDNIFWTIVGAAISAVLTLLLINFIRPKIQIGTPFLETDDKNSTKIHVPVFNESRCSDAINVKIEFALVHEGKTKHLSIDKDDFLILPNKCNGDNSRIFKALLIDKFSDRTLRVRVYAQHCFTGFGKSFQKSFQKDNNTYHEI
jgi:hypothetical protein